METIRERTIPNTHQELGLSPKDIAWIRLGKTAFVAGGVGALNEYRRQRDEILPETDKEAGWKRELEVIKRSDKALIMKEAAKCAAVALAKEGIKNGFTKNKEERGEQVRPSKGHLHFAPAF